MSRKDPEERRAYNAAYEATNREKINARKAAYRAANIGKVRAQRAASWLAGKEKYAAYAEAYRQTPEAKSHMKAHMKAYRQTPEFKAKRNTQLKERLSTDIQFKMQENLRSRLYGAIRGTRKAGSAIRDLGCSLVELKARLELLFQPGMTWDNWSLDGWHIDHIKPLSSFDLTDREQFKRACHFSNLQPLWAIENLSKGAKHPNELGILI